MQEGRLHVCKTKNKWSSMIDPRPYVSRSLTNRYLDIARRRRPQELPLTLDPSREVIDPLEAEEMIENLRDRLGYWARLLFDAKWLEYPRRLTAMELAVLYEIPLALVKEALHELRETILATIELPTLRRVRGSVPMAKKKPKKQYIDQEIIDLLAGSEKWWSKEEILTHIKKSHPGNKGSRLPHALKYARDRNLLQERRRDGPQKEYRVLSRFIITGDERMKSAGLRKVIVAPPPPEVIEWEQDNYLRGEVP